MCVGGGGVGGVGGARRGEGSGPPTRRGAGRPNPRCSLARPLAPSRPSPGDFKARTAGIGAVKGLSFSSDGRLLALGGEDGSIELWEWPAMRRAARWEASPKPIRNVDFSPAHGDGVLLACDEGGACRLWDLEGHEIAQLAAPAGACVRSVGGGAAA